MHIPVNLKYTVDLLNWRNFPQIECILLVDLQTNYLTRWNIILSYISKYPGGVSFFRFSGNNSAQVLHHCHTCYMPRPSCLPWWAPGKKYKFRASLLHTFLYFPFIALVSLASNNAHPKFTHTHTHIQGVLSYSLPQQHRASSLGYCSFFYTHYPAGVHGIWRQSSACSSCGHETSVSVHRLFHPLYPEQSTPVLNEASLETVAKRQIHVSARIRNLSRQALK